MVIHTFVVETSKIPSIKVEIEVVVDPMKDATVDRIRDRIFDATGSIPPEK